jgi:hypothetical protein
MNQTENGKPKVYVNAILCDKVVRSKDDFLTAITITSGYVLSPLKIAPLLKGGALDVDRAQFVLQPLRVNLIITFVTEESAEFETTIKIIGPGMGESNTHRFPVKTGAGAQAHTMSMNIGIGIPVIGEYWFEVYVGEDLATKTPMRIKHRSVQNVEPLPILDHLPLEAEDPSEGRN